MGRKFAIGGVVLGLAVAFLAAGCTRVNPKAQGRGNKTPAAQAHDDWWCAEHGIPEEECALCNKKLAAELKQKGDWCAKHARPNSQCFVCHPELKEQFAAKYRAKYGKEPPPVEGETPPEKATASEGKK